MEYHPPGPKGAAFFNSDAFVRGIMGPVGSGKTTLCIMDILRRAQAQEQAIVNGARTGRRKTRWGVIRNTYPDLRTTTIKSWHQWVPAATGRWVDSGPPTAHIINDDIDLEVLFLALDKPDDIKKLLSLELTGGWINEAREVPKAILDALTARVGRYPSALDGGATWSGIVMDTNPPDEDHWYYRLAEESRPRGFEFYRQPGGRSPDAENLENLPAGYYDRIVEGKSPEWIKVYVDAEYGFVMEGKAVYPEFVDSIHVQPVRPVPSLPLSLGLDFGLTPAAVIGQRLPLGRWIILDEVVTEDMGAVRFAEVVAAQVEERFPGYLIDDISGDPSGDIRAQTDEKTIFEILKANGLDARPAPSNDFILRREAVAKPLTRLIDGKPGLIIDPRCRQLRKAMAGGYCYKRLAVAGAERYHDKPDKNALSHVAEALQYLLLGAGEGKALVRSATAQRRGNGLQMTANMRKPGKR